MDNTNSVIHVISTTPRTAAPSSWSVVDNLVDKGDVRDGFASDHWGCLDQPKTGGAW